MTKQLLRSTVLYLALIMLLVISCKKDKDPKPSEQDLFVEQLSTSWVVSEVTVDEVDVTDAFKNLTLSFTKEKTYTTTNSVAPIWPASGTFTVVQGSAVYAFTLQRNDGVTMKVVSTPTIQLQLEFNYSAPINRTKQVSGRYEFTFSKK